MNKLPEKQVKELREHLTNAALIIEELVQMVEAHHDECEERLCNTDTIRRAFHEINDVENDISCARTTLDELRHANLTPYSSGQPRG